MTELLDNPRNVMRHVHFEDVQTVNRTLPRLVARMRRLMRSEMTARIDHPTRGVRNINVRLSPVRMEDGAEILARRPGAAPVTALAWDADGTFIAFGTEDGEAGLIRLG